jgi:hypothetical protein
LVLALRCAAPRGLLRAARAPPPRMADDGGRRRAADKLEDAAEEGPWWRDGVRDNFGGGSAPHRPVRVSAAPSLLRHAHTLAHARTHACAACCAAQPGR